MTFELLSPEILLVLTLAGLIVAEVGYHGERIRLITITTVLGLFAAGLQVLSVYRGVSSRLIESIFVVDGFSYFFKLFAIVLALAIVMIAAFSKEIAEGRRAEYYSFVTAGTLASCIAASSINLMMVFLVFQFQNVLAYFMAGYRKQRSSSVEAAFKYMMFSLVASMLFLFAVAILFANTHTLNIYEMQKVLSSRPLEGNTGLIVFVLIFLSIGFCMGAFPMYLWMPDVLSGAPTPTSVFLGLGVPASGIVVGLRLFMVVFSQPRYGSGEWPNLVNPNWIFIIGLSAGLTMLAGTLLALRQTKVKRLLACLIVAQGGFFLLGLLVLNRQAVSALFFNMIVALVALVGIYFSFSFLYDTIQSDEVSDFSGIFKKSIPESLALLIFFACFVGMPPFPGFIGRFVLIGAAVDQKWYILSVIAVLSSVLGIAAFARFAFSITGVGNRVTIVPVGQQRVLILSLLLPLGLLAIYADSVLTWVGSSLDRIFW